MRLVIKSGTKLEEVENWFKKQRWVERGSENAMAHTFMGIAVGMALVKTKMPENTEIVYDYKVLDLSRTELACHVVRIEL